jgi:hypothetical protein
MVIHYKFHSMTEMWMEVKILYRCCILSSMRFRNYNWRWTLSSLMDSQFINCDVFHLKAIIWFSVDSFYFPLINYQCKKCLAGEWWWESVNRNQNSKAEVNVINIHNSHIKTHSFGGFNLLCVYDIIEFDCCYLQLLFHINQTHIKSRMRDLSNSWELFW